MSRKKNPTPEIRQAQDDMKIVRRARLVHELRDGRRQRAATFTDRKKEAARRACRKGAW